MVDCVVVVAEVVVGVAGGNGWRRQVVAGAAGVGLGAGAWAWASPSRVVTDGWSSVVLGLVVLGWLGALAVLAYPFHEAVHAVAFRLCGVQWRDLVWGLASCSAPGWRLTRPAHVVVLAAPYPVLVLVASWSCRHGVLVASWSCRHGVLVVPGVLLLAVLPFTSIKDVRRLAGVLRARRGLVWEDVTGASLGWAVPAAPVAKV